jgi:diguanylate cyclase (GGDEF)-like protein
MPRRRFIRGGARRARAGEPRLGGGFFIRRRFALLAIVLVVAILGADWLIIGMERAASIEDFRTATTNLANGMAAQTGAALAKVDAALRDTQSRLADARSVPTNFGQADGAGWGGRGAHDMLAANAMRIAWVDEIIVAAPDGTIINRSAASSPPGTIADSDVLVHFKGEDDTGVFVGQPFRAGAEGEWSVFLARRLNAPDGAFGGVVIANLRLAGLAEFYHVAMPPHRMVTLTRTDGVVLVRYPRGTADTGRRIPQSADWYVAAGAGGGSFVAADDFGAGAVIAVVRPLPGLPLVIEASVAQGDALAGWRRQRVWLMAGGVAMCLFSLLLLRLFAVQIRRLSVRNTQLEEARGQLRVAMSNISQGLCFFDGDYRLIVCNQRYGEMYRLPPSCMEPGVSLAEIVEHCYAAGGTTDFTREEYIVSRMALARSRAPHHSVFTMSDGRTIAVQQQPMPDGGWVATHDDITERRRAEDKINFMALHDALTGLPNRSLLKQRLEQALGHADRGIGFGVLFLDLDRFKSVNDTLGHAVGDALLCAVAARLQKTVREGDTVARLGGDEFVVLQSFLGSSDDASVLARRIIAEVAAPYRIANNEVVIGVSIGIAITMKSSISADAMLKNADMALYISKGAGRGTFRFFEPEMDATVQKRHAMERDLRGALARHEFELHYQPIVDVGSGELCGYEALLRWNHPLRGVVGADEFIRVAEETGLVIPIGQWMIEQACAQAAMWPNKFHVAVKLSAAQFRAVNLVAAARDALASAGLPAWRLELEISEAVLLRSSERNVAVLHQLRECGIGIVLDDFGVGYSSLGHLRRFPFDRLKIDPSFVEALGVRPDAVCFVRAIIRLCQDLGVKTAAGGVATSEQLAILSAEGCALVQGPLFGRATPAHLLEGVGMLAGASVQ